VESGGTPALLRKTRASEGGQEGGVSYERGTPVAAAQDVGDDAGGLQSPEVLNPKP